VTPPAFRRSRRRSRTPSSTCRRAPERRRGRPTERDFNRRRPSSVRLTECRPPEIGSQPCSTA
jgi:hypothetical protein